jgi:hypothetical protein
MATGDNQPVTRSRIGLLIIRAWVEPGSPSPLRAQIRCTTDVSQGLEYSLTVAEEEATVEAVRAWLSQVLAGSGEGGSDSDPL